MKFSPLAVITWCKLIIARNVTIFCQSECTHLCTLHNSFMDIFIPSFILYSFHLKFPLFGNELNIWGYTGKGRSKHGIIVGAKSSQHRKTDRQKTCKEKNKFKLRVFKLMSLTCCITLVVQSRIVQTAVKIYGKEEDLRPFFIIILQSNCFCYL